MPAVGAYWVCLKKQYVIEHEGLETVTLGTEMVCLAQWKSSGSKKPRPR
jgi:hypothetical protein